MSDLIDRRAAIDAINHICPIDTEYDCTLLDRVDVRCVLTDLPSAQRWIPVSERLPEIEKRVLILNDDNRCGIAFLRRREDHWPDEWMIMYCLYDADIWDEGENGKIVAWMPLPEPWKGEKDEAD